MRIENHSTVPVNVTVPAVGIQYCTCTSRPQYDNTPVVFNIQKVLSVVRSTGYIRWKNTR